MRTILFLVLSLALATFPALAVADDEQAQQPIDCSSSCPDGQVMVSFTDGNDVTCLCQPAAEMDPTVSDPDIENADQNS